MFLGAGGALSAAAAHGAKYDTRLGEFSRQAPWAAEFRTHWR